MVDFGYSLSTSSTIDLDKSNPTLFNKLVEDEPDVLKCMACGSCAASCTSSKYRDTNLRRAILLLSRGQDKNGIESIHSCMLCGKCNIVCPRGINTRHLILSISNLYKL